jgi:hypothetical protein
MVLKRSTDRHSPTRFKTYQEIHTNVLNQFISRDFVSEETLEFAPVLGLDCISLCGEIACLGEIIIQVRKRLKIKEFFEGDVLVFTDSYAYNVSVKRRGNIFRFDNEDKDYLRPNHFDEHHKHTFNWLTNTEDENSPIWVGVNNWLTLGETIQLTEDWYWQNYKTLPNPDRYCKPEYRGSFLHLILVTQYGNDRYRTN